MLSKIQYSRGQSTLNAPFIVSDERYWRGAEEKGCGWERRRIAISVLSSAPS